MVAMSTTVVMQKINRIEVIGPNGREYVRYGSNGLVIVEQDDGRTLKVFLRQPTEGENE